VFLYKIKKLDSLLNASGRTYLDPAPETENVYGHTSKNIMQLNFLAPRSATCRIRNDA